MAETKAYERAIDAVNEAFCEYKATNDARLASIEKSGHEDVLYDEKLQRVDDAILRQEKQLEKLHTHMSSPDFSTLSSSDFVEKSGNIKGSSSSRYKDVLDNYLKHGLLDNQAITFHGSSDFGSSFVGDFAFSKDGKSLEATLQSENKGASSFEKAPISLVPGVYDKVIESDIRSYSVLRNYAEVQTIMGQHFVKPIVADGLQSGWVKSDQARPQTVAPDIRELRVPVCELYAMPMVTTSFLEDSHLDVESWLRNSVEKVFGDKENEAFTNGSSKDTEPQGFQSVSKRVNTGNLSFNESGYIKTGVNGAFKSADNLIELVHSLRGNYRQNAVFMLNRNTLSNVRSLKQSDGRYVWQPAQNIGQPSTILGYGVAENDAMPNMTTGNDGIVFGDFKSAYLIVDRREYNLLRDPYSAKPYVIFYVTKRTGGAVQDHRALKFLRFVT